jgi:hypothetical protein
MVINQQEGNTWKCEICNQPIDLNEEDLDIDIPSKNIQDVKVTVPDYCSDKCRTTGEL